MGDRDQRPLQHLTEWQELARSYREAERVKNKVAMDRIIRHAYDLALAQFRLIPRDKSPVVFQRNFLIDRGNPTNKKVRTSTNGAWLDEMAKWSRTVMAEA